MDQHASYSLAVALGSLAVLQVVAAIALLALFVPESMFSRSESYHRFRLHGEFLILPILFVLVRCNYSWITLGFRSLFRKSEFMWAIALSSIRLALSIGMAILLVPGWFESRDPLVATGMDHIIVFGFFPLLFLTGIGEAAFQSRALSLCLAGTKAWNNALYIAGFGVASCGWLSSLLFLMCIFGQISLVAPLGCLMLATANLTVARHLSWRAQRTFEAHP